MAPTSGTPNIAGNPPNDASIGATITIPGLSASNANNARQAKYISGNSLTLAVYVSQPGTSTFTPVVSLYDLTNPTACPGGTCNLLIPAPSGTDDLYFVTYADSFSTAWTQHAGGNPTSNGTLHPLDASLVFISVKPGTQTVALTMAAIADGVAAADDNLTIGVPVATWTSGNLTTPVAAAAATAYPFFPGKTSGILDFDDAGAPPLPAAIPTATAYPITGPLPTGANAPTSNVPSPPPFITLTAADGKRNALSCGNSAVTNHFNLGVKAAGAASFSAAAATAQVKSVLDQLQLSSPGAAGVGYVGSVSSTPLGFYDGANAVDSSPFTLSLVTLGVYNANATYFNCAAQSLTLTSQNEVEAVAVISGNDTTATDFSITPSTNAGPNSCASVAQITTSNPSPNPGPTVAAAAISTTPNVTGATALATTAPIANPSGGGTTTAPVFWVRPAAVPSAGPCVVQIARTNGLANGTTYSYLSINVQGVGTGSFPGPVAVGTIVEYPIPTAGSNAFDIASGPDGALWFPESGAAKIGRVTTTGTFTEYSIPSGNAGNLIVAGPDGALWFTENAANKIGRITTGGTVSEFSTGISANSGLYGITAGSDGNLWFAENGTKKVGRITTAGVVTEFGTMTGSPTRITSGPDGNLWIAENSSTGPIARVTTAGVISEFSVGMSNAAFPFGIAAGSDGALWFMESNLPQIGRVTTSGSISEFPISSGHKPVFAAAGPDGNVWFTTGLFNTLGRITPAGVVTEFPNAAGGQQPQGITTGPDGGIWFTDYAANKIGRIQP